MLLSTNLKCWLNKIVCLYVCQAYVWLVAMVITYKSVAYIHVI